VLVNVEVGTDDVRSLLVDARTSAVTSLGLRVDPGALAAVTPDGGVVDARGTVHSPFSHTSMWNGGTVLRTLDTSTARRLVALGPGPGGPVSLLRAPEGSPLQWQSLAAVHLGDASGLFELAGDVVGVARPVDVEEPWWAVVADPALRSIAGRVLVGGLFGLLVAAVAVAMSRRAGRRPPRPAPVSPRPGPTDPPGPS
jgi:hypothetical protein